MSEDDKKKTNHVLEEISEEPNLMARLQFENEDEPIFIKFKLKREYELFINTIYLESDHRD